MLVTHDQEEALELSTHIVLLDEGRVVQTGSPTELYDHPCNAFVAAFIGEAKVLTGRVEQGRARFARHALSASVDLAEGAVVEAFVRPGDVRVSKAATGVPSSRVAWVQRLVRIGNASKLSLELPDGDMLMVELPHRELQAQGIRRGDRVLLELLEARFSCRPRCVA